SDLLPPANTPGVGSAASAPAGGPVSLRLAGGARLALWPGFAGTNAVDLRIPGATEPTTNIGTARSGAVLRRAPDGTYAGLLTALPQGRMRLRIASQPRPLTADVTLGAHSGAPPVSAPPTPAPLRFPARRPRRGRPPPPRPPTWPSAASASAGTRSG